MYYVVYRKEEVIDGPYPVKQANHIAEDLIMVFSDPNYEVMEETGLASYHLQPKAHFSIHEDLPTP